MKLINSNKKYATNVNLSEIAQKNLIKNFD